MQLKMLENNLLLLPGLDGTGSLFRPFLSELPPEYPASIVSYPNQEKLSYKQMLPLIRAKLPWDKPVVLIAESFSGPLALEFAVSEREQVSAIVLVNTFVTNPAPSWLRWAEGLLRESLFKRLPSDNVLKKYMLGEDVPEGLLAFFKNVVGGVAPEVMLDRVRQVLAVDARVALQNCRKPLLYLLGDQDKLLGKRGWEVMAAFHPHMTTVLLDGPHLLLQRKPKECWAAIEMFLKGLQGEEKLARVGQAA